MRRIGFAAWLALAAVVSPGAPAEARELTFEQRVQAQEAIERVYSSHQIGAIRPFEEAVPRTVLEKKVRTYLKESAALEAFWNTPVTAEMLRLTVDALLDQLQGIQEVINLYAPEGQRGGRPRASRVLTRLTRLQDQLYRFLEFDRFRAS